MTTSASDVTRTPALNRAEAFRAVRYNMTAELAGRRFEQFPVDVALSEHPTAPSERLPIPSLLDFADIQPVAMPVIALEQHIAEKVHAYTATYGPQQQPSTRIKDLIDLLLIAEFAMPNADRLRDSLDATFRNRARQPLPSALPAPPPGWTATYARAAEAVGLPTDLDTGYTDVVTFLDPVLAGTATDCWNPTRERWTAT